MYDFSIRLKVSSCFKNEQKERRKIVTIVCNDLMLKKCFCVLEMEKIHR